MKNAVPLKPLLNEVAWEIPYLTKKRIDLIELCGKKDEQLAEKDKRIKELEYMRGDLAMEIANLKARIAKLANDDSLCPLVSCVEGCPLRKEAKKILDSEG